MRRDLSELKLSPTYNLTVLYPELAKEWHPTRNGDLTPEEVTPGSDRKVWWRCSQGHEWESTIGSRTRGTGCPDWLQGTQTTQKIKSFS